MGLGFRGQRSIVAGSLILFSTCKSETRRDVLFVCIACIRFEGGGGKKKKACSRALFGNNKTFLGDVEIPPTLTSNLCVVSWRESFRANTSPKRRSVYGLGAVIAYIPSGEPRNPAAGATDA